MKSFDRRNACDFAALAVASSFRKLSLLTAVLAALVGSVLPLAVLAADGDKPASRDEAARFLARATFGPTDVDVARLTSVGYGPWIDEQVARSPAQVRLYVEKNLATYGKVGQGDVMNGIWSGMLSDPAQLRQRVAFALSQIFTISLVDGGVHSEPRGAASYYDMLAQKGLGNYRALLEGVALHPMMGQYLSHRGNQKANPATGRVPDENFAREVMQLFSIGLHELNADGSLRRDGEGKPIESYGPDDVAGLAKVFTGWSWACAGGPLDGCFSDNSPRKTGDANSDIKPMIGYPQFHSGEEKRFLGVTIAQQGSPNPTTSLRIALDTLFNHPNTAPFISKQLIQRLVSSNPSPRYVADVAAKFANNGAGVRGDMAAVVRTILLHPEANELSTTSGKVREPILRLTAFVRAFPFSSVSGGYRIGSTDDAVMALQQTPMNAASVFNFFRPTYAPAGSQAQAMGLVAPEMQLVDDTSIAGVVYFMNKTIDGAAVGVGSDSTRDVKLNFDAELALATNPAGLMSRINSRLTYGTMSPALQTELTGIVERMQIPVLKPDGSNLAAVNTAKRMRVNAALLLTIASPEFIVQKSAPGTANQAPTVSLTAPALANVGIAVNVSAAAADSDGTIVKVDFYDGAMLIGSDTSAPFSTMWTPTVGGVHSLTARATDNLGATTTSAVATSTVSGVGNQAPTVSLTAPSQATVGVAKYLSATAADSDGTIAKVEFYDGAKLIGSDTSAPYSTLWTPTVGGVHSLTARATDNLGATKTSAVATSTVSGGNQAPTVSLTAPSQATVGVDKYLSATAADSDGTIVKVEFYDGAMLIGSDTSAPYSTMWTPTVAGVRSLTARATDNLGATKTSAVQTSTVAAGV